MNIELTGQGGVRLLTGGKFCTQNIQVIPALQRKTADANGTYTPDEGYAGLEEVVVAVPVPDGYIQPSGTASITENGTHDVSGYASAQVNVPSGSPVLQTKEITIVTNGTYEYTPDSGYDGLGKIVFAVNVASGDSEDDSEPAGLYQDGVLVMDWATIKATYPSVVTEDGILVRDSTTKTSYFADLTGDLVLSDEVKSISAYAFKYADNITSVFVPASVTVIEDCAFFASDGLKEVNVSNANGYYKSVDGVLYTKDGTVLMVHPKGRTNTEYVIPDGVTTIAYEAFAASKSLTTITIGKDVTTIRKFAFEYCTALKKVYIPASVSEILDSAFYRCDSLANIYYEGTQTQWGQISLEASGNSNLTSASFTYNYSF